MKKYTFFVAFDTNYYPHFDIWGISLKEALNSFHNIFPNFILEDIYCVGEEVKSLSASTL